MTSKEASEEPVLSTPLIPPSRWASGNFQLAAGCCMIQPSTKKVVLVYDSGTKRWFLPRGRKDVGETLEQAAFREGYEESGFRPEPLPLLLPHIQPSSPAQMQARRTDPFNSKHWLTTTEPVYITTIPAPGHGRRQGYEYTCFWYAASLPPDAVRETDTGMEDEKDYIGKLLYIEEALRLLRDPESYVLWFTYKIWEQTCQTLQEEEEKARPAPKASKEGETGSLSTSSDLMSSMV